jgi:hypothetical protein
MAKVSDAEVGLPARTKGGDILTGEDIDALAAEAEAGYDLTKARRERVGRPSLDEGRSPRVSFRMARALYEAALAQAEREGRTVSELARDALERYLGQV